jgi:hypothetical protein
MPGHPASTGRRWALPLLAAVCALAASGCARQTTTAESPSAEHAVGKLHAITVTANDTGRTVTLRVGDHLDLVLGTVQPTGDEWRLVTYPERLLSLLPAPVGHYQFVAFAPGRGTLTASSIPVCAPTDNPDPIRCRSAGAGTRTPPRRPDKRFTLTIRVQ